MSETLHFYFPKSLKVRRRSEYARLSKKGERSFGKMLIVEVIKKGEVTRLGITASKAYGDSHERNRFKRLVREAFRLVHLELPVGYDLNVKPRPYAKGVKLSAIKEELLKLVNQSVMRAELRLDVGNGICNIRSDG